MDYESRTDGSCSQSTSFMGEETYEPGDTLSRSTPTFICDPIDGTTNFVHAYPYVSISLGLAFGPRNPLIGVVYNPFTRSLYSAIKGRGAYLNRTIPLPLKGSFASSQDQNSAGSERAVQSHSSVLAAGYRPLEPLTSLSQALLALEWGSDRTGNDFALKASTYAKLCQPREEGGAMVHGIRSFGSAALNMCGVAEGSLDMYWESGCWAWDVCGAWVVLTEAGGRVLDGNPPIEGQESEAWDADAEKDTGVRVDGRRYLCVRKGTDENVIREFWSMLEGRLSYGP